MVQIVTLNNRQAWAVDDSGGRGREVLKRWEKSWVTLLPLSQVAHHFGFAPWGKSKVERRETSFSIIVSEVFCKKHGKDTCGMNELPGGSKEVELQ